MTISYLLALSITHSADASEPKTALSVKMKQQINKKPPTRQSDDFKTLLKMDNAFIDKSLIIKEILQHKDKVMVITRPRKWGKSINLNMLRLFLKIELDKEGEIIPPETTQNHHLFTKGEISEIGVSDKLKNPLLIAREKDVLEQYLGKYPVIHVRLDSLRGHNFRSLVNQVRRAVSATYTEHRYMNDVFDDIIFDNVSTNCQKAKMEKYANLFRKHLSNDKTDLRKAMESLAFLSKVLHMHFKKPVFVLMDDYDAPIRIAILNETFIASDKPKFFKFYENFLGHTFTKNSFLVKGVLTGLMSLPYLEPFTHPLSNLSDPFHEFFGFTEREVELLFDHYKIPNQTKAKAYQWYQSFPNSSLRMYNPWSIHSFLNEKKIRNYWLDKDEAKVYLKTLLKNGEFKEAFSELVFNNEVKVHPSDVHFTVGDYMYLQNFMRGRIKENVTNVALMFFHTHGYLTSRFIDNDSVVLQFPNREISTEMRHELVRFSRNDLGIIDPDKIKPEIEQFKDFINTERPNGTVLAEIIKKLFRFRLFQFNEKKVHTILNYLAVYCESYKRFVSEVSNDSVPDLVFIGRDRSVIIKFTMKAGNPGKALYRAKMCRSVLPSNKTEIVFVGINISTTRSVEVQIHVTPPAD